MSKPKTENGSVRVLVTGASGYIAAHVVRLLLENGYKVRGTVRSLSNEKKIRPLRQLHAAAAKNLELVEADLLNADSWHKAVDGCTYVMHVASPFPSEDPYDPDILYKPAIDGTLNVLRAVDKNGKVKRVILTSSTAAVLGDGDDGRIRDENDWTNMTDNVSIYAKSKTLAERAAWDFMKDHNSFELTVLNPGYVIGPLLHDCDCTSAELIQRMLNFQMPMVPNVCLPIVDVRDVAEAHLRAMVTPEAKGLRICLANRTVYFVEVAKIVKEEFSRQGYWVMTMVAPYYGVWLVSIFDKGARLALMNIGKNLQIDNTRMRNILHLEPTPIRASVIDMAYSLIERAFVKKTAGYEGPPDKN